MGKMFNALMVKAGVEVMKENDHSNPNGRLEYSLVRKILFEATDSTYYETDHAERSRNELKAVEIPEYLLNEFFDVVKKRSSSASINNLHEVEYLLKFLKGLKPKGRRRAQKEMISEAESALIDLNSDAEFTKYLLVLAIVAGLLWYYMNMNANKNTVKRYE